jgi:5-methylcytosine-specific restriction endonuclease McrA
MGKIKREQLLQKELWHADPPAVCGLCGREIPKHLVQAHHMIPKSKGGKQTQLLHSICHRQIHALFTENELATKFNTLEALLQNPDILSFVNWIKNKPIDFKELTRKSKRLKSI